jgi:hypothetical protein
MRRNFLALTVWRLLLISFTTVKSQSSLDIKRADDGNSYMIDNPLPVAVSAFIVGRDRHATIPASTIVTIPARTRKHQVAIHGEVLRVEERKTFFRRLSHSNRWAARLYRPLSATSASVRILMPGESKWAALDSRIPAGRPSFAEAYQKAEKARLQQSKNIRGL